MLPCIYYCSECQRTVNLPSVQREDEEAERRCPYCDFHFSEGGFLLYDFDVSDPEGLNIVPYKVNNTSLEGRNVVEADLIPAFEFIVRYTVTPHRFFTVPRGGDEYTRMNNILVTGPVMRYIIYNLSIPRQLESIEATNPVRCTVCQSDVCAGEGGFRLECGHIFHRYCILRWLRTSTKCPNCNHVLSFNMP